MTLYILKLVSNQVILKMVLFNEQFNELVKVTLSERQYIKNDQTDGKIQDVNKSAKSQDFFQDNNPLGKKYTTTQIKSRNFLSNITYVGINKEDFYNENFIFDVYFLVTKNLNPFSLDRNLADKTKHEMIYTLWKECMPQKFYKHICKEKNFLYLNGKNVLQPKVLQRITDFLKDDEENYKDLHNNLSSYKNIFQYVYSNVFPEIYCSTERRSFNIKSNFHLIFETYKDKKQLEISLGKNPENYETIRNETSIFEQKPINVDDFNEIKKKEVKNKNKNGREVAEKNRLLKKKENRRNLKKREKNVETFR